MIDAVKERLEEVNDARNRVKTGESEEEEVDGPLGLKIRFRRGPDDTVETFVGTGGEASVAWIRTFPEASDRPLTYPGDLPFLPSVSASIRAHGSGRGRSVTWHRVMDISEKASSVRKQLTESGWVMTKKSEILLGLLGHEIEFRKGEAYRKLVVHVNLWGRTKLGLTERFSIP